LKRKEKKKFESFRHFLHALSKNQLILIYSLFKKKKMKKKTFITSVPPRWIVEPADVNVERNRHVTLHCQAQGVPIPTIVWKKATGKTLLYISRDISFLFFMRIKTQKISLIILTPSYGVHKLILFIQLIT
jgi:hypothetical protein